ncbi:unnamed protein product [Bemisia tabaci]|uniref:Small ribosomal subunit protein mS26 n=1 Tax=Bemisia tabaci TaxID=7038 RepID=A0A9P0ANW1_BEMTA|nr:unnamed protein product [Bemisia tabaci]
MASLLRTSLNPRNVLRLGSNIEPQFSPATTPWTQTVRWRRDRKPMWLGPSKSKRYWVPPRPNQPLEEKVELRRLFTRYKTEVSALHDLIKENMKEVQEKQKQALQFQSKEEEEAEWVECMAINDDWNAESAALREQRIARELEAVEERALQLKLARDEEKRKLAAELNAKVRAEKERSKTYITPENIDEAIEQALNTVVDFNYSIDLRGNKYIGKRTKPESQNAKRISDSHEPIKREIAA